METSALCGGNLGVHVTRFSGAYAVALRDAIPTFMTYCFDYVLVLRTADKKLAHDRLPSRPCACGVRRVVAWKS